MLQSVFRRHVRSAHLLCVMAAMALVFLTVPTAMAQSLIEQLRPFIGQLTPERLRQLQQALQQEGEPGVLVESPLDQARRDQARRSAEQRRQRGDIGALIRERALEQALAEPPSPLESDFSARIGSLVRQFGYDVFRPGVAAPGPKVGAIRLGVLAPGPMVGAIHESYVLGIGDELVVTFHGQVSRIVRTLIDREGRVILPKLPPIPAAGRAYGDFVRELRALTAASMLGTEVFVSLGAVRSVSVLIVGEVVRPGVHQLTGLSTVFDGMVAAGGVKKTGSLRRIRVVRGDATFWLDAYDLLFTGLFDRDVRIFEGDRIVVPPIGATVAVAGKVKRPAIYELREGRSSIALDRLLELASGLLRPKGNRFLQVSIDPSGLEQIVERDLGSAAPVSDGDILLVTYRENILLGSAVLDGHVRLRQRRSVVSAPTVRRLIGEGTLLEDNPYLLFAALRTIDPQTRTAKFIPLNLEHVLEGRTDYTLKSDDTLIVLSADDIGYLASSDVQAVLSGRPLPLNRIDPTRLDQESVRKLEPGTRAKIDAIRQTRRDRSQQSQFDTLQQVRAAALRQPQAGALARTERGIIDRSRLEPLGRPDLATVTPICSGLRKLATIKASARTGRYASAIRAVLSDQEVTLENRLPCPEIFDRYGDLLPFLLDYVVSLNGEVQVPGAYPILPGTSLSSVAAVAGGLTREVDLTSIELTRFTVESLAGTSRVERGYLALATTGLKNVVVNPGDSVRFNPVFTDRDTGPVRLVGEFVRPGLYEIRRGERLSELIARAGGITPQAYPYGAVFTRERVKQAEREANQRAANELESAFVTALTTRGQTAVQQAAAAEAVRGLAGELRERPPVGRVVIEADPAVLALRPEGDMVLEPGDRLFMPKKPNSVSVIGEVLNPGTLQHAVGLEPDDYIDKAGGFRKSADDTRVFIVLPNGTAQRVALSAWNRTPAQIPPGSMIVVPRDPTPFNLLAFLTDTTAILSQVAISAASLAVINR